MQCEDFATKVETAITSANDATGQEYAMKYRKIEPLLYQLAATVRKAFADGPQPTGNDFRYLPQVASNMIERFLGREREKFKKIIKDKTTAGKLQQSGRKLIIAQCEKTQSNLNEAVAAYKDKAKSAGATIVDANKDGYPIGANMSLQHKQRTFGRKVSYHRFLYELDTGMHSQMAAMMDHVRANYAKIQEVKALMSSVDNNVKISQIKDLEKIWPLVLKDFEKIKI